MGASWLLSAELGAQHWNSLWKMWCPWWLLPPWDGVYTLPLLTDQARQRKGGSAVVTARS